MMISTFPRLRSRDHHGILFSVKNEDLAPTESGTSREFEWTGKPWECFNDLGSFNTRVQRLRRWEYINHIRSL